MNIETKKCPMCAEEIPLAAVTCEYCGAQFEVTSSGYCQNCHQIREANEDNKCNVCGNTLVDVHVKSRLIEQSIQAPVQPSQPEKRNRNNVLIPIGIIMVIVILVGVFALIWVYKDNISSIPQSGSTVEPTVTLTSAPTLEPTSTQRPTSPPRPTATRKPSSGLLAPSELKATPECVNISSSSKPGGNRWELSIFITWKDNATNELGYIIYLFNTEIARVDANTTRFAVSKQSRYAIYTSDEYGVVAWNNQSKSEKMVVQAFFSCP